MGRLNLIIFTSFIFLVNVSLAAGELEDLVDAQIAIKTNKYGTLNSLSALRQLQNTLNGPPEVLDVFKSNREVFEKRFLIPFPPAPISSGAVDNRPGAIEKFFEGVDSTSKVPIIPLIRSNDKFDRGLTSPEKEEAKRLIKDLIAIYDNASLEPVDKELISFVLSGYFNVEPAKGVDKDDPDFIEFNFLINKLGNVQDSLLNGQANLLEEMERNSEEAIQEISKRATQVVGAARDHLSRKVGLLSENFETELNAKNQIANGQFEDLRAGHQRIEQRLIFLEDRLTLTQVKQEIFQERDPERLELLLENSQECDESVARCRVLKANVDKIRQRKIDLEFEIQMDIARNISSALSGVSKLMNNPELSKIAVTLDKVVLTVETVDKMNNLLSSALASGSLAAMGDVTSMVSLGASLIGAFSESGPSPEQLILEQLVQIQEQIQELRNEMHERFDELDQKVVDIGVVLDVQFFNMNSNQIVQTNNQQYMIDLMAHNSLSISNSTQLIRKEILATKIEELRKISNRIASTHDFDELEGYFFDIVGSFSAYLEYKEVFEVIWSDPRIESDDVDRLQKLVTDSLSGGDLTRIQWIDLLSQLANYSHNSLGNESCMIENNNVLAWFNAFSDPVASAFREKFDDYETIGSMSSNKFHHFLQTAPIEKAYFEQMKKPYVEYTTAVKNLKKCLQSFSRSNNTQVSYMQYLLALYSKEVADYLDTVGQIFSHDGELTAALLDSFKNPQSPIQKQIGDKFINLNPERTDFLNLSEVERYNSYDDLKEEMPRNKIINELFPEVPSCDGDPSKSRKIPANVIANTLPRHETWISFLLGLNSIELCQGVAEGQERIIGENSQVRVFTLQYHLSGFPRSYDFHPPYTLNQVFHLRAGDVPGSMKKEKVSKTIFLNGMEREVLIDANFWELDSQAIFDNFINSEQILARNPVCFTHKDYISQCWPGDHDENFVKYLPDVTYQNKLPPYRDRFIFLKGEAGVEQFDKLNVQESDLRLFFDQTKEMLDGCRKALVLNNSYCEFSPVKALTSKQADLESLSSRILKLNQLIRLSAHTMMSPKPDKRSGEVEVYLDNFSLMMMSPTDIVELVVYSDDGVDFQKNLEEVRVNLDSGFLYIYNEWPNNMSTDVEWLLETDGYLEIESQLLKMAE